MWYNHKKDKKPDKESKPSPSVADDDSRNVVETLNNKIYFYSEVTRPKVLTLNKKINTLNISLTNQAHGLGLSEAQATIQLHISSYGGSVFAGMAASSASTNGYCLIFWLWALDYGN